MKGRQIPYSAAEREWLHANTELPRTDLHAQFVAKFARPEVTKDQIKAVCTRMGLKTGRTGCWAIGQPAPNKGKPMPYNPNSAATRFKKGQEPHNTNHLGHERTTREGYIEISVAEVNPHTGYPRRYVAKHRHLWVQANGPIPEGHRLKCLDGNKANTAPENWKAVPIGMVIRLSGPHGRDYDAAPAELKPTIMAVTELEHAAKTAIKGKSHA